MKDRSESIYQEVDALIRAGQVNEARQRLSGLRRTQLSSTYRGKIASLARRADLPHIALILLRPYVHPAEGQAAVATEEEKSEYAAALADLGAGLEAIKLLSQVNKQKYPPALLHTAFAYFSQWDYAAAIPILKEYIACPENTKQQNMVGRVNLAASLVHEKDKAAEILLDELLQESIQAKYALAEGYIRMLSTEYYTYNKKWELAEEHLTLAEKIYSDANAIEGLFLRKWKAILNMYSHGSKTNANIYLDPIRREAREKKNWETLRDCDFNEAVFTQNESLFLKVYFGTSYTAKKQRLLKEYNKSYQLPESYNWNLNNTGQDTKWNIDILRDKGSRSLPSGQTAYRLFFSLSSDFYRPLRIAELHDHAYPNEFFNPLSSPAKVHQGICRLRQWLKKQAFPLEIKEVEGSYSLTTKNDKVAVCVPNLQMAETRSEGAVQKLKLSLGTAETFTLKEAAEVLGGSYWHVNRLLKQAEEDGKLVKTAKGRSTRYAFPDTQLTKKSA